jgi:hypothetical protein
MARPSLLRRKYRHDPEFLWLVVEVWPDVDRPLRVHSFDDAEPAREFVEGSSERVRYGPYPLLRTPLERAAPLLAAAAATALGVLPLAPEDPTADARAFLELTLRLASLDVKLPDVYRDVRRVLLYENRTPADDPRRAIEDALKVHLEKRTRIL